MEKIKVQKHPWGKSIEIFHYKDMVIVLLCIKKGYDKYNPAQYVQKNNVMVKK